MMLKQTQIAHNGHITMAPETRVVRVMIGEREVARSTSAIRFSEGDRADIFYIPLADIDLTLFARSDHQTRCKWKGDATYRHFIGAEPKVDNALWHYSDAFDEAAPIRDCASFDLTKAEVSIDE